MSPSHDYGMLDLSSLTWIRGFQAVSSTPSWRPVSVEKPPVLFHAKVLAACHSGLDHLRLKCVPEVRAFFFILETITLERQLGDKQASFHSVVVITCASHAQGRRFEPGRKQIFLFQSAIVLIARWEQSCHCNTQGSMV